MKHFLTNDLLHKNQSGFRPNHFCRTALTELTDAWLSDINLKKIGCALFIEFAKAFHVISHNLLLKKMNIYGLTTDTLNLIKSFLSDRHQVVSVKNKQSEVKPLVFGVPQGSVLGPLLFSIYINDLPLHISSGRCDMLADDTTIHTSGRDIPSIVAALQSCVSDIIEWTHINHMSLNPSKTNYMCNGVEWSKDKTQAAESIKWRPQQAYCSNQFLLVQPQTVFSTHTQNPHAHA